MKWKYVSSRTLIDKANKRVSFADEKVPDEPSNKLEKKHPDSANIRQPPS